jgi:hypothetical protein
MRAGLFGLLIVVALGINVGLDETGPAIGVRSAVAQTQNETLTSRVGRWTRARFEAARKHWAEHEQLFSACNSELQAKKSGQRMSYGRQARFLEDCMRRKHR